SAALIMASIRSSFMSTLSVPGSNTLPASMGPPDTNTTGMFSRMAAISIPGVILSQFEMHTMASAQWALTMYSTESAMSSRDGKEYSMPSCPIAIPSSTAMVLNSLATPPAASIWRATSWPMSFRCTWPGTNCVNEFTTAMMGFSKSSSFMPVARHSARAPAMLRPCVEVRDRYCGIVLSAKGSMSRAYHETPRQPGAFDDDLWFPQRHNDNLPPQVLFHDRSKREEGKRSIRERNAAATRIIPPQRPAARYPPVGPYSRRGHSRKRRQGHLRNHRESPTCGGELPP